MGSAYKSDALLVKLSFRSLGLTNCVSGFLPPREPKEEEHLGLKTTLLLFSRKNTNDKNSKKILKKMKSHKTLMIFKPPRTLKFT